MPVHGVLELGARGSVRFGLAEVNIRALSAQYDEQVVTNYIG